MRVLSFLRCVVSEQDEAAQQQEQYPREKQRLFGEDNVGDVEQDANYKKYFSIKRASAFVANPRPCPSGFMGVHGPHQDVHKCPPSQQANLWVFFSRRLACFENGRGH
jgi:hypothetical protein